MEQTLSFEVAIFQPDVWAEEAARHIVAALPGGGSLVLTGGTTAEQIYPRLVGKRDWTGVTFAFSDERCVPPDDAASNYGMARRLFLDPAGATQVLRMQGELPPEHAAGAYSSEIASLVERGFDLMLLGMGADNHIGALSPHSPALESEAYCAAVERPDGLGGLTLTPPAILPARKILLLVAGAGKADAVARAINSDDPPTACPVRLLADHPDATFLLDTPAASAL